VLHLVESVVGPIQSSPMHPIPKAPLPEEPERWRMIEDFSSPYNSRGVSSSLAVNFEVNPKDFPANYKKWRDVSSFFRGLPSHAIVFTVDFLDGFEHLDLDPVVRPRLAFTVDEDVYIRSCAPFGFVAIPGEFSTSVELTLEGVNRHFKGKVVAISHMDDCSFAILDPSITMEDVIKVIESF
ncbi:hypothetical protein JCM10213_001616, partial [Rhodosporidiobolus nylandii]